MGWDGFGFFFADGDGQKKVRGGRFLVLMIFRLFPMRGEEMGFPEEDAGCCWVRFLLLCQW